jgi:hypothetical protein
VIPAPKTRPHSPRPRVLQTAPLAAVVASLLALGLAGCGGAAGVDGTAACNGAGDAPTEVVADAGTDRLSILNNDAALGGLVTCPGADVPIEAAAANQKALLGGTKHVTPPAPGVKLTLVAEVDPPTVVGLPRFIGTGGTGANDLAAGGTFTGDGPVFYRVEIDAAPGGGAADTFRWSDDGGATWRDEGVAIGADPYLLGQGVTIQFGAETGHAAGDAWVFEAARLQATSVTMNGDHQVVSYAVAGAPHLGGIQVFQKFTKDPVLRSQVLFRDTEIHAADVAQGFVYGAGATEPGTFTDLAELERFKLEGSKLTLDQYARIGLPSFAATGVTRDERNVYATSGTTGGLSVLDPGTLATTTFYALDDARWVAVEKNQVAVARGGALGGNLAVYDEAAGALSAAGLLPFDGADTPEAKTTVEIKKGNAYIAAGRAGVRVISLATGAVRATLDPPVVAGLDPADVAANAVTVDNDLMFISFGGAGVYVAKAGCRFDELKDGDPLVLTVLGHLAFGDFASTNHVAYLGDHLFVASGLGGLKIVRVDRSAAKS